MMKQARFTYEKLHHVWILVLLIEMGFLAARLLFQTVQHLLLFLVD